MNVRTLRPEQIGLRAVFALAWPVMVSMFSHTLMTVSDTIFVGQLGTVPLAAVGIAAVLGFLVTSFGAGLMKGTRVVVSQKAGAGAHELAGRSAVQGLYLAVGCGAAATLLIPFAPAILGIAGASGEVNVLARSYFSVHVLGAPIVFLFIGISAYFQGIGDTKTPMAASVFANLLNIALDPVLIFGLGPVPALGVAGAAWATLIAQTVGLIWLLRQVSVALRDVSWKLDRPLAREVWSLGYPIGIRWALDVASYVVFASVLARVGTVDLAAHFIVIRIVSVSFLPGHAIGEAAGVLVGQSIGAGRPEGAVAAHRAGIQLACAVMFGWGLVFVLVPGPLVAVFGAEPEVMALAQQLLLIAAAFQLFDAVAMVAQSAINSAGETRFVMVTGVLLGWGVKLPVGYALAIPMGLGAAGAWLGLTAEIVLLGGVSLWYVQSGRWLGAVRAPRQALAATT